MPDVPSPFRTPEPAEQPWWWEMLDADGAPLREGSLSEEYADQRFPSQADAESWIGEVYSELLDEGVEAVVLHVTEGESDRLVYGPMSLRAG